MRFEHVEFEVDDQVGVVTLDRPEAANAQSQKVLMELDQAWEMAKGNRDIKVIVLWSTGKHFSAGHDMASAESNTLDGRFRSRMRCMTGRLAATSTTRSGGAMCRSRRSRPCRASALPRG